MKISYALLFVTSLISGCATPLVHVTNQVFNFGQELPSVMVNRHIAGMVGFDEDWTGNYNRPSRTTLYSQGVEEGSPLYRYRVARINLANPGEALYIKSGELLFPTGALVPDHLPRLRAGDVVEVRQTGTWRTMEKFLSTGEGNIVVRVLCRKADPDYVQCLDRSPSVGKAKGAGETHTAYPPSVAGYGYQFSPWYDSKGQPLRAWPTTSQ